VTSESVFSALDTKQLESIGKSREMAEQELHRYRAGIPAVELRRACNPGDGIICLAEADQREYAKYFEEAQAYGRAMKFVAASGAASRMFSAPRICLDQGWVALESLSMRSALGDPNAKTTLALVWNIREFAFFDELRSVMLQHGLCIESLLAAGDFKAVLEHLLMPEGLGYDGLPKGLIPFYRHPERPLSAFEEHLAESVGYLRDRNGLIRVHFTVSSQHHDRIAEHLRRAAAFLDTKDTRFGLTLSIQASSADSVAVDLDNRPLRDSAGKLILRPSGHGALLENLNSIDGDIVFIRTVDNLLPHSLAEKAAAQRRMLAGVLAALQAELFPILKRVSYDTRDEAAVRRLEQLAESRLGLKMPPGFARKTLQERSSILYHRLNAPIRVCGMIRTQGYPGGRPFWIADREGIEGLQIIEPAQADLEDEEQRRIWKSCQFFNPADLVCGVRDYLGHPFNLLEYCDQEMGFITRKTYEGLEGRILERPGLWNGGMAHWITILVEVPGFMVRPVKTVLDLPNSL
jgi:hypothetical protein